MVLKYRCAGQGYFGDPIVFSNGSCANVIDGTEYPAYFARTGSGNLANAEELYLYVCIEFYDDTSGNPIAVDGSAEFEVTVHGTWDYDQIPCLASVGWGIPQGSTFSQDNIVFETAIPVSYKDEDPTYKSINFYGLSKYAFFLRGMTRGVEACPDPGNPDYEGLEIWVAPSILEIKLNELQLSIPLPTAAFSASPQVGVAPLTVEFTDLSSYVGAWLWEFGDGDTSDVQHPIHTYENPGLYSVALTAANYKGQDTAIQEDYILVLPGYDSGAARRRRAAWQDLERPSIL